MRGLVGLERSGSAMEVLVRWIYEMVRAVGLTDDIAINVEVLAAA